MSLSYNDYVKSLALGQMTNFLCLAIHLKDGELPHSMRAVYVRCSVQLLPADM